jgi:nucleoside-diphosphate-sugar epimerase
MLQPPVAGQAESQEGGLRISLCHVEDAADALLHFAEHGAPPLINLASAEALSLREIAHCLGERMRATPEFKLDVKPRSFDLVAETTLLAKFCPVRFRLFREGLASLFDEAQFDAR